MQVNIPSKCRTDTIACLREGGTVTDSMFDRARQECYVLMSRDTLPRFTQSPGFIELLAYFGSYDVDKAIGGERDIELDLDLMSA